MPERRPSLEPGARLGPYQVLAAIGAGGMGEVYRAHDTVLGRQVAVKVLAERFGADPDRLARLDREARVLASLNHPNIATIYGVDPSAGQTALILELVEGPTLDGLLAGGALGLRDALAVARQIASALEAAHEHGVIHRDLKPANIKLRPDGTVKVLDFGIAKVIDEAGHGVGIDQPPTITATSPGTVLGTAPYMSPEQACGAEVTRRSDVWAFGAVLYEMLTGKRAFNGPTRTEVLAAILHSTPDWTALPPSTPPAIARLVRRCLERDPRARLHDIGDARIEIEDVERGPAAETSASAIPAAGSNARTNVARRTALGVAAIAIAAALAVAAYLFLGREGVVAPEVRLQLPPPPGMHFVSVPAVSPDGRMIAFVAASDVGRPGRLWIRSLSATASTELPGSDGAIFPFWSWDSRSIGFFADRKLKRVPASGGNPVAVCDAENGRGGVWLADDTIVFAPNPFSPLMRVNASGGTPSALTTLSEGETGHRFPFHVSGRYIAYFSVGSDADQTGTRIISIDAPGRSLNFFPGLTNAHYVHGALVFVRSAGVLAQSLTLPDGPLTGEPMSIGRARISEVFGHFMMAAAPSGVVVMLGPIEGVGQLTWMSRDGRALGTVGEPSSQLGVELSPDGRQIAIMRPGGIWTMNLERPVPNRVADGSHPMWSPDGARILSLFQGRGVGTFDLAATTLATGASEVVWETGPAPVRTTGVVKPQAWSRDGTIVWINGTSKSLWTMPIGDPRRAVELLNDGAVKPEARLSPDGHWIAYATDRSGRFEVEVRSFPAMGPRYPVSTEGGGYPRWRGDGRELYFVSPSSQFMSIAFAPGTPPSIGRPELLFEARFPTHPNRFQFAGYGYDVSSDGSRFLVNRLVSEPETSMTVITNWTPPR